jgi:small subunit ribosomal protein S8
MGVVTDPLADLLTRIRNASRAGHDQVEIPASKVKLQVVKILAQEKFIRGYQLLQAGPQGTIRVFLKYGPKREPALTQLERVSKPGLRVYAPADDVPRVQNGLGISILTTSQGVLADRDCRRLRVGGEVICKVW